MGAIAVAIAGVAVGAEMLQSGAATPKPAHHHVALVPDAGALIGMTRMSDSMHHAAAMAEMKTIQRARKAAHRRHLAEVAAARRAARAAHARSQSPPPSPSPSPSPSSPSSPPPSSGGGTDAAHSALGICIRDAEEGGSYAWGPGNGGGAYQFVLGTWERYGGAASEYGVADAAYQDKIFDNAIAAGGASNWTDYDGC
jgi:Transglycosylase-like domain